MRYPRSPKNLANARSLRRNMTPQERHLWYDFLRYCRPRFRRQELIVEVDGSQHFTPELREQDNARTAYFHSLDIRVLRVDNGQVNRNFSGVCEGIVLAMQQCGVETGLEME